MSNTQEYLIDAANLITLPDIYIAVKEAVEDPDIGMMELADIVSYDPAISTKLLKIANSSFYGQVSEINTIKKSCFFAWDKNSSRHSFDHLRFNCISIYCWRKL